MKKKAFACQLSKLRINKDLTQQQAADAIGITRGRLNNYEQGSREPDIDTLTALAEFYHVSVGCLIGHDEARLNQIRNNEINEALAFFRRIKQLSPDKQKIIEILTKEDESTEKQPTS